MHTFMKPATSSSTVLLLGYLVISTTLPFALSYKESHNFAQSATKGTISARALFNKSELHVAPQNWQPTAHPSIFNKYLNRDDQGTATLIQKYAPGTVTTETTCHQYYEEVYILEGALYDTSLAQWFGKDSYCYRHPGMLHGPYESPQGCTMFVRTEMCPGLADVNL
ncbi:uncharacterized protein CANTADRAFT_4887 [Suhomyces tanzawaensis NRRL Y-17324]|uniref:ChrR-like cupin domain-containing protein n=1 Tax=Suhomyces tanzawaensis NRRL Y-17324 TaxID=984487 RepID=A0A1E4SN01_9ASCO|nr:uncharacterized protein CANTADRAFT_4887 [Suhomyces tanzawaensis NRRL Y-17324]ODV80893.1 hypothetical protein CANTADRAFT_4887 [Suhomyces tanzawaensis NRRL Y-17324]